MLFAAMKKLPPSFFGRSFIFWILLVCVLYCCLEYYYLSHAIFTTDDFWLAFHIYQYKHSIPYRDFAPYKTVLGYYLYLLPMCLSSDPIKPLLYVKETAVVVNAFFMMILSVRLRQFYSDRAILAALILVAFSHLFLIYSSEIRVDLLAYWLCALAVILIFENKMVFAGLCLGFGFLISQKSAWYIVAIDMAFLSFCLSGLSYKKIVKQLLLLNSVLIAVIGGYIVFWAGFSSLDVVWHSVFYEAYLVSTLDSYRALQAQYWLSVLQNNALLLLLWPLAFISLFVLPKGEDIFFRRVFLFILTSMMFLFLCFYRQAFPYNFVVLAPIFFLLYTDFFAWLMRIFHAEYLTKWSDQCLFGLLLFYALAFIGLSLYLGLHGIHFLMVLVPLALAYLLFSEKKTENVKSAASTLIYLPIVFLGMICPVIWFGNVMSGMDNRYQFSMVSLLNTLLKEGDEYVAGVPLLYNKAQPTPGLKHLVMPSLDYMKHPDATIAHVLLPSLYLAPVSSQQIIQSLQDRPVKVYVNNNRFRLLPADLQDYFAAHYAHFWGSIYVYAPSVEKNETGIQIAFDGDYKLVGKNAVFLDHEQVWPNHDVYLKKGYHDARASTGYRLVLIPHVGSAYLDAAFQDDDWAALVL
ncbi:MAG: hypothetical protein P4M14_00475 [Gammaproteobacteria bacterium]|nr:hypothetical protein [Gammaproteobacteria bacterium]